MRRGPHPLWIVLFALANVRGSCGTTCPPEERPVPMTASRARQLEPEIETGLAVSTTHVWGDCRAVEAPQADSKKCSTNTNAACARERGPFRVQVVEVNQSIPLDPACDGQFAVSDLAPLAAVDAYASESGELVAALPAGHYTVYVSVDDRCAICGVMTGDGSCRVEVISRAVTAKDIVVDEATH